MVKKVVLAYSGGLDTSIMIPWLKENYGCEVIAFAADVGQGKELDGLEEKALKTGASKVYIEDLTEEFITDFIYPTLKAGAVYENKYLLGTSFARPLIAKKQVEIALKEGADAVAHGATGKGNDQVRFELTFMSLAPQLEIIAPWKDAKWDINSREEAIDYAQKRGIPIPVSKEKIYSEDANIWHISHEGGELEDPTKEPLERVYTLSKTLEEAPDKASYVEIGFEKGIPITVNGEKLPPVALVTKLNKIGAENAIGQIDVFEDRLVGIKSRGVYETPGGTLLYEAHNILETLILDKQTYMEKQKLSQRYAELVYNGDWFTTLREALDAFVDKTQEQVTGSVKLKLYKGNMVFAGANSEHALYSEELASFANSDLYNQEDATGFIKLYGLQSKVKGMKSRGDLK